MDKLSFEMTNYFNRIKDNERINKEEINELNSNITEMARRNIGDNIANYSNSTGLSYENIAKMLGYSGHSSISNISNENQLPSLEVLIKLSLLTNKSLDELVFDSTISKANTDKDVIEKHKQDIKETEYELNGFIEILYKTLRKHNSGGLFYLPDDFVQFLKHTVKENDFVSDISLKTYNILEKFRQSENIVQLKSSKDLKEFKNNISKEQMQNIENIIPKKRDRTIFNEFIIKFIYNKLTSEE